jgi:hypothetical protein
MIEPCSGTYQIQFALYTAPRRPSFLGWVASAFSLFRFCRSSSDLSVPLPLILII